MKSSGIPEETIDDWIARAKEELLNPPRPWSVKYDLAWAVKRA